MPSREKTDNWICLTFNEFFSLVLITFATRPNKLAIRARQFDASPR